MRTTLLFTALVLSTAALCATLPPNTSATIALHMREVNAQWNVQDPIAGTSQHAIAFGSEAARIAMHLHLVREQLAARKVLRLSAEQRNNREQLLGRLEAYADRGIFPQNELLSYRNPVFIDHYGTACAVGQLIIESGHRDLSERLSKEMNHGYVLDMPASQLWPEVAAWANEHGFTAQELAWIQPTYSPNYPWTPLGTGTNGNVTVVRALANGDVLFAGDFTVAGGTPMSHVAIWNGTNYVALGAGLLGTVNCAVEFNGNIYLGGAMLNGWSDLAMWNGSSWTFSTLFDGKYPLINALHVHNNELYAAGAMSGFAGNTEFVQHLNGSTWETVGSPLNGPVYALGTHDGKLIAGGDFTSIVIPALPPPVLHVAQLGDSDWEQLGDGLDAAVRVLLDVNGTLYAGGDVYVNIAVTFGLARIAPSAVYWEAMLPNHVNYMPSDLGPNYISSLAVRNDEVYFGGKFIISPLMGTSGNNLGRSMGVPDAVEPLIVLDAPVNGVAVSGSDLFIGGAFSISYPYTATLDLTTIIVDPPERIAFTLVPNPATETLYLTIGDMTQRNLTATITDIAGRVVIVQAKGDAPAMSIDVRDLPTGSYQLLLDVDGIVNAQRFVKQ